MNNGTRAIISAALAADTSVTPQQKEIVFACLTGKPLERSASLPEIVSRREVARLLGKTVKRVDQIASAGYLKRVPVPGSRRALGYTEESVRAVLEGRAEQAGQEVAG